MTAYQSARPAVTRITPATVRTPRVLTIVGARQADATEPGRNGHTPGPFDDKPARPDGPTNLRR